MTVGKWAKLEKLITLAGGKPAAQKFLEELKASPKIEVKVEVKAKSTKKRGKGTS